MQLLTIEDLAKELSVKKSWIYRKVRDEKNPLPKVKLGKYLRFNPVEIQHYLNENR